MKIVALQAENVKKLTAIEIRPDGNLVQITGKNGQGKTSILDSIWWALAGATHIQAQPIQKGATKARIRLDLGEIIVTRTFKATDEGYTTGISVENAEGVKYPSPQTMLDKLLGQLTFDPLAFTRLDVKEQFNTLAHFVPEIDFDAHQAAHQADYDLRTGINRKAVEAKAAAAKIEVPPDCQTEKVDTTALTAAIVAAGKSNTDRELRKANREKALSTAKSNLERCQVSLKDADARWTAKINDQEAALKLSRSQAEAELKSLSGNIAPMQDELAKTEAKIATAGPLAEVVDTAPLEAKIASASAVNKQVELWLTRQNWIKEAGDKAAEAQTVTDRIDARQKDLKAKISAAKFPVDGLTLEPGQVLLNGLPFNQAAESQQLRASVAVAMALNPKLRVIRIKDGSLLDADGMKLLSEMADKQDFQIWCERVANDGKVGFVIEDGELKSGPEPSKSVVPAPKPSVIVTPAPAPVAVAQTEELL